MNMKAEMKMNKKSQAVILLSGGLDSIVALDYVLKHTDINIELALTFNYGQKAAAKEIELSAKICKYYNLKHKIIELDWLKEITKTALVSSNAVPTENLNTKSSAESVWVPNRNALFLNIAGCYCDSFGYKYIIYGANRDEAKTFPDNTEIFRNEITTLFKSSTLVKPEVYAPLINYSKDDIVKIAVKDSVPLELVWSCYESGSKHCGECESCKHLKRALITNQSKKYLDILFKNEN